MQVVFAFCDYVCEMLFLLSLLVFRSVERKLYGIVVVTRGLIIGVLLAPPSMVT
jgi:hypothetical protein